MTESATARDVVDILTVDHREALDLLTSIRTAADADKRDLTDTLISELVRHSVAEEMYVYPAMREHLVDGDEAVQHDVEEHKELDQTMKQLEAIEPSDPKFAAILDQLEATLRDHIADEETDQFPELRAAIPRDELIEIGEKVELAKKMAPTRPHPSAPRDQLFHKLVGPGVGLVDRLRDAISNRSN